MIFIWGLYYKKGCTRLAAASDFVYQLLANGRWFSPGTLVSPTTKTGRHDIADILLKVALTHQKSKIKSYQGYMLSWHFTHMRKASAWPNHFTKRGGLDFGPPISLTQSRFTWSACTEPGKWAIMTCALRVSILFHCTYFFYWSTFQCEQFRQWGVVFSFCLISSIIIPVVIVLTILFKFCNRYPRTTNCFVTTKMILTL